MNLESALKGSLLSYAAWCVLFGTASTLGMRIAHVVGWTLGWLFLSLVYQTFKERQ